MILTQQAARLFRQELITMSMQTRAAAVSRRQAAAARRAERRHVVRTERHATRSALREMVRGAR
jgi:hypothetical protein